MPRTLLRIAVALALLFAWRGLVPAAPQNIPVPGALQKKGAVTKIEVQVEPESAKRGQTVVWRLKMDLAEHFHTYPTEQANPASRYKTRIEFNPKPNADSPPPPTQVVPVEKVRSPSPLRPLTEAGESFQVIEGTAVWEQTFVVKPDAPPGPTTIRVKVSSQVCDERGCTPFVLRLETPLTVTSDSVPVEAKYQDAVKQATGAAPAPPKSVPETPRQAPETAAPAGSAAPVLDDPQSYRSGMKDVQGQLIRKEAVNLSLMSFLLTGIFWGAVSLVTPCVFPMIPITVSYFLKQSEKEHHRPLTMALVYCATIVIVLTVAAVLLLSFFRQLSVNPIMNYALGALFIFFALSLFGMYEIELPAGLARFTSAREGKGGLAGTMFMALTFTIVSFACVAPFLGGFGGTAATQGLPWYALVLGGLAFSLTFASPFFVLALFPTLLKRLPKSGSWLNSVKVVMGFLELAAALKFLRAGELVSSSNPTFFTYDLVLGLYVALCVLCGLYLLGVYRLPHDSPAEHVSVPQLLWSIIFLSLGLYLAPGLFHYGSEGAKQRPSGTIFAWVDSFLLPDPGEVKNTELAWSVDLKQAVERNRKLRAEGKGKPIFIDFTGELCTNCRYNEGNVFSKPEIRDLLKRYELVQLYTDWVPTQYVRDPSRRQEFAEINQDFQQDVFNTIQLPLYAILQPRPDGKIEVVSVYDEGKINDVARFTQFLKDPLEQGNAQARLGD
jgi:thiol:disulfide interchange protein DsbD